MRKTLPLYIIFVLLVGQKIYAFDRYVFSFTGATAQANFELSAIGGCPTAVMDIQGLKGTQVDGLTTTELKQVHIGISLIGCDGISTFFSGEINPPEENEKIESTGASFLMPVIVNDQWGNAVSISLKTDWTINGFPTTTFTRTHYAVPGPNGYLFRTRGWSRVYPTKPSASLNLNGVILDQVGEVYSSTIEFKKNAEISVTK